MSIVTIRCPRLGSFVSTGVEAEPIEFRLLGPKIFRMRCSVCGSEHLWSQATAWLSEAKTIKVKAQPSNKDSPLSRFIGDLNERPRKSDRTEPIPRGDYIAGIIDRLLSDPSR